MTTIHRRHFLLASGVASLAGILAGCGQAESRTIIAPVEIDAGSTCDLDGMLLADYPGPKAQIHYAGATAPVFFCDTVEMFAAVLSPEQVKPIRAVFVQDMGKADWEQPRGHWFDAKAGFYVVGSKRRGSMGPTIASFAVQADATRFAGEYGGQVLRFAEVKPNMADLAGGAVHDTKM
jgi:copper chaperone NosL